MLLGLLPMFLILTTINPLFNTYGAHILFSVFGRPYTLEALLYGAAIASVFCGNDAVVRLLQCGNDQR